MNTFHGLLMLALGEENAQRRAVSGGKCTRYRRKLSSLLVQDAYIIVCNLRLSAGAVAPMRAICTEGMYNLRKRVTGVAHNMREKFTITQAANRLGVSRRTLYNWLEREKEHARKLQGDQRASWLTQGQIEELARKHGRQLDHNASLDALAMRLETFESAITERIEAIEARLEASEHGRIPSARASASTSAHSAYSPRIAGAIQKAEAARLVADRHRVHFATARQWPWPPEALESQDAALRWALQYVASVAPHKRPDGWLERCDVLDCPCQSMP